MSSINTLLTPFIKQIYKKKKAVKMKKEREKFLSSIYIIIKNENGEILLQRRQGTKLWPGFLALPAGHID